ncbi:MAG: hypothetical protein WC900_04130 [Oscillospiraceae bacterium]
MEIKNYINAVHAYKTASASKGKRGKSSEISASKNTDKIEFSSSKLSASDGLKKAVSKAVSSDASPERLSALSVLVEEGKYSISSESIAKAILE